jgi:exopolysaccharide biosynthesis polyprenyl glycosylphosphotransferase
VPRALGALSEAPTRASVARRERSYRLHLAAADGFAGLLALYAAVTLIGDDRLRPGAVLVVPIVVVASKLMGLYHRDELVLKKTTLEESAPLFQLATVFALITWLLDSVLVDGYLGNRQVLGLWGLLFVMSLLARTLAREIARRRAPAERCLVVGSRDATHHVIRGLQETRRVKADVIGRMPLDGSERPHHRVMADLEQAIVAGDVHRVILAPEHTDSDEFLDMISLVKSLGVRVSVLPRIFEVVGTAVEFDTLNGVTVLGIRRFGLVRSSRAVKRAMDIVGSLLALIALAPVMVAIAISIRLTSRGPVLFRQTRVGRDGRRFTMLKFRTMVEGADALKARLATRNEADGLFKISDDPRVTRVGRLLRRTSMDELPQLVNVLRGEMSLVGPRPLVVDEDSKIQGRHRRRLHLTPGMTGDWQILGSARIPLHEMVKIDYLYVTNWSLWGDVKILARTVLYVFGARSC